MRDNCQVVFSRWSAAHWDAGTRLIIGGGMPLLTLLTTRLFITRMGRWGRWTGDCIPGRHPHVWPPQAGWGSHFYNKLETERQCKSAQLGWASDSMLWFSSYAWDISIVFKVGPLRSGDIYHLTRTRWVTYGASNSQIQIKLILSYT